MACAFSGFCSGTLNLATWTEVICSLCHVFGVHRSSEKTDGRRAVLRGQVLALHNINHGFAGARSIVTMATLRGFRMRAGWLHRLNFLWLAICHRVWRFSRPMPSQAPYSPDIKWNALFRDIKPIMFLILSLWLLRCFPHEARLWLTAPFYFFLI